MRRLCGWNWALALVLVWTPAARADLLTSSGGLNGLGSFAGSFTYTPTDATTGSLAVELTNSSDPARGGFLTAFVFNNPGGKITGVSLTGAPAHFALIAGGYDNGINGAPFGQFDIGVSTGGSFEGGGNPSGGLGVGLSGTFHFTLTGAGLNTLDTASFFNTLSVPPGAGEGTQAFVARFRGFQPSGSDKVPGVLTPDDITTADVLPEPASCVLAVGGAGLALLGWRSRKKRSPA